MDYFGPVVNLAARVSGAARGGEIVCSGGTAEALVKAIADHPILQAVVPIGEQQLKGIANKVRCVRGMRGGEWLMVSAIGDDGRRRYLC